MMQVGRMIEHYLFVWRKDVVTRTHGRRVITVDGIIRSQEYTSVLPISAHLRPPAPVTRVHIA